MRLLIAFGGAVLLGGAALGAPSAAVVPTGTPAYAIHVAPPSMGAGAYEPSIGVNWKSGATMYIAGTETLRVTFDSAGQATWKDVSGDLTSITTADPILASDNVNGRVFVSQLTGFDSLSEFTDDDGETWNPSQGGGIPSGADHQSIGAGPYPAGSVVSALTDYPNAVYYCSQQAATAFCARSDNGGTTFGAGVPIYTIGDCGGLHGHVRVGPDGTVYVPNKNCSGSPTSTSGTQAVAVSRDAGLTWTLKHVPGTKPNLYIIDPSIGIASDNTLYFGAVGSDYQPVVAVSTDHGDTWSDPIDVGEQVGVENATFPEVIAGDGDRAAFAFLGTTTAGNPQSANFGKSGSEYTGAEYHLYVASTFDRGKTWKTVDVTGNDPVQRGRVCNTGTTCTSSDRNLADFMDIQVDKEGRVLVAVPDGCTGACVDSTLVRDNKFASKATIARQISGTRLFAAATEAVAAPPQQNPPPSSTPPEKPAGNGGVLAATGGSVALAALGFVGLTCALLLRRRHVR